MIPAMKAYLDLLEHVLTHGKPREDRTGVGTIGVFGHQMRVDLRAGFPLLTTKKLPFRWIAAELLWFLSGSTDERALRAQGVDIWKEWATEEQCARFARKEGDLGPIYGWQWRHFGGDYSLLRTIEKDRANGDYDEGGEEDARIVRNASGFDQIAWVEREIVKNPFSRRLVVSAWDPADAQRVALPPCHTLFQFYVSEEHFAGVGYSGTSKLLSCHLYARSIDAFLGLPFNVASYALLTHLMARSTGLGVGELVISFGDLHLYRNHLDQARKQCGRVPRPLPRLRICPRAERPGILGYLADDFALEGYDPHPAIRAEVAV